MKKKLIQKPKAFAIKKSKCLLALLLICAILVSLCACADKEIDATPTIKETVGPDPVTVKREPSPPAIKAANNAAILAVRQYVYARLKTEAFVTANFPGMSPNALSKMVDELAGLWETAQRLTEGTEKIADQALILLKTPTIKKTANGGRSDVRLIPLVVMTSSYQAVPLAASNKKQWDHKTWAENLTKQYDAIKGGQTIKQLAKQLGTDAKEAYAQLSLAQEIIHSGAMADAETYDMLMKTAQEIKTACKVGLFVTATVASGGGTLSALAGSSVTLVEGGALIVGGADCIVDIASTGSSIFLGEDHQVSVGFSDIKDKLAPLSAVVGLATFNPAQTGEQLSYIGDTLADWFYEGKIMGIKVSGDNSGTKIEAKPIDVSQMNEAQIKDVIESAGFVTPEQQPAAEPSTAIETTAKKLEISKEEALAILDSLKSQLTTIAKAAGQIENNAAPGNVKEALEELGVDSLTGTYTGKMTMTKVEVVYDSEDVDENGNILHVYRPDGKNEWGDWEGMAIDATLEFVQENNVVRVLDEDGETAFELAYDPLTHIWKSSKAFSLGKRMTEGKFSKVDGRILVKILITETYENSEVPDGKNETTMELTKLK